MKTALVTTEFWKDNKLYNLNIDTKLLYLFYTTCPERNTTRFYRCNDRLVSAYVGISNNLLELCKSQLSDNNLIYFKDDWVIIGDQSYVQPNTGKLTKSIYPKDMAAVPEDVLDLARQKGIEIVMKLSTGKSSGAAPEYIYNNKDNTVTDLAKWQSGVQYSQTQEVWELDDNGNAKFVD